jgi:hemoglobin/transferrin/lactoferrin receptor protein
MIVFHLATATLAAVVAIAAGPESATGTLSGNVRDPQGAAIAGARVDVVCGSDHRQSMSGPTGEFSISGLPQSRCLITASSALFDAATAEVDLSKGEARTTLVMPIPAFETSVTVTASRGIDEQTFRVPQPTSSTTREQIDARPYALLPQALREEAGILVQQTSAGQVSPTIRGFTGTSNVYLIDGVRLNTSAWRGGPSQYFGWVEGTAVERLEVVRGPGSVQYGSDALGGTINVLTKQRPYSTGGLQIGGEAATELRTADRSTGGQAELSLRSAAATFRVGGSTRRIQDLRSGGGIDSHSAATRFLGLPSTVFDPSRLKDTAFDQSGGFVVGSARAGDTGTINGTFMHENQTGASRYDRIYGGDGLYKSGFSPQTLDFGMVRYQETSVAGFDAVSGTFSVNRQSDGRFEQTRPTAALDQQRSDTRALGYQLLANRMAGPRHQISTGTEFYDEAITASREQVNPLTAAVTSQRPDIPNGTEYKNFGVFAQDVMELVPNRVSVRGGLRYGRFNFSTVADPAFGVTPDSVTMNAVTFQTGAVVRVSEQVNATLSVSRGFRASNSADLGSIGLSGGGGFGISPSAAAALGGFVGSTGSTDAVSTGVAIPALRPEVVYAYEPGVRIRAGRFSGALTAFDLEYLDTPQRRAIVFPGNVVGTSIFGYQVVRQDAAGLAYIAQDIRPIGTSVNVDRARVLGFEANGDVRLTRQWTATAYYAMSNGKLQSTGEYMRRMSPPIGGARLRWSAARTWVEGAVTFAQAQTRLNSGDLTDARIGATRTRTSITNYFNGTATDLGLVKGGILLATGETVAQVQTRLLGSAGSGLLFSNGPGFVALGVRGGLSVTSHFDLIVIGENLTDRNYRLYGSGVDSPGINLEVKARYRF